VVIDLRTDIMESISHLKNVNFHIKKNHFNNNHSGNEQTNIHVGFL